MTGGQPHSDRLSLVLEPAWWRQHNLCTLLVASADVEEPAFATVVPHGCAIANLLPPSFRPTSTRSDVYVTGGQGFDGPGELVRLKEAGSPAQQLRSAQDILSDSSLAVDPEQLPEDRVPRASYLALLGLEFEHTVVEVGEGAVAPQLAAVVHASVQDLFFWY